MSKKKTKTKADFIYSGKSQTNILLEVPSENNPFISKKNYLHGYDLSELIHKKSFVDTLLLLFSGELPEQYKTDLLNRLMIALINLGPRHPAVKAAMVAGVSKTNTEHLLPIGLSVLGGHSNGANEVASSVSFILSNISENPKIVAQNLLKEYQLNNEQGEFHLCAGFGNQYGSIDELVQTLSEDVFSPLTFDNTINTPYMDWVVEFNKILNANGLGLLKTGLAATVFCELGIPPRESIGLYQLLCAPGIFAHGVEQTHKPITAMPMLTDEQHIYQSNGKTS